MLMSSVLVALSLLLLNSYLRPVDVTSINMYTVHSLYTVHVKAHNVRNCVVSQCDCK